MNCRASGLARLRWLGALAGVGLLAMPAVGAAPASESAAPAENAGANAAIARITRGAYAYRTLSDGHERGAERFELVAHPDGTRTLVMWNAYEGGGGQYHVVLRADARFRPLGADYEYWNDGRFKGVGHFSLAGSTLRGWVRTPEGRIVEQEATVPEAVSFATHPLAGDGWHAWYVDSSRAGDQPATLVNFDSSPDVAVPALARVQSQKWAYGGRETIEVPAGRFDCERYTAGASTVWVSGPDRMLVRYRWAALDREYVLVQHEGRGVEARNPAVARYAEGEYAYRTLGDGRVRGWERFRLTVHPDGTRSMLAWHGLQARSAQFTVMLRVDRGFRPLDASVEYWNEGRYKGSAAMFVADGAVDVVSEGSWGTYRERVPMPAWFSIGTHPVAADGWHVPPAGIRVDAAQVLGLEAGADTARPIRGRLAPMHVEEVGEERIRVPAGEFDTVHWRYEGGTDVWLAGEDRVMIRMRNAAADREYVLTALRAGTGGPPR